MFDDDGKMNDPVSQQPLPATTPNKKQISSNNNSSILEAPSSLGIEQWVVDDVHQWADKSGEFSHTLADCLRSEAIDGPVLLSLTEQDIRDLRYKLDYKITFGEMKKFWLTVCNIQHQWKLEHNNAKMPLNCSPTTHPTTAFLGLASHGPVFMPLRLADPCADTSLPDEPCFIADCETLGKNHKRTTNIAPEYFKTAISLGYSFVVTWITSFVMVIVHERVPDMKRYPPLPDIFLDNVPHIPWAFNMCEITGSLLFTVWLIVLIFHKYRMVLLRRFFALAGTVFLLRCVTMLITSLSVPGTHLQCNQKDFAIDDPNVDLFGALVIRMTRAYRIWSGLGMSIQGVRTCGDYMFSGHTVALTLLNFFITEYTPRNLYFLHTLTWLLNMFGIFFILAAHEHYSIDVFVAFYITSRLFLYYHTLANNRALMQSDSNRTRIWFPMFSYFENHVDGIIPNEFETLGSLIDSLIGFIIWAKIEIVTRVQDYTMTKDPKSFLANALPQVYNRTHAVASNYLSPHESVVSNSRLGSSRGATDLIRDSHNSSSASPGTTHQHRRPTTTSVVDANPRAGSPALGKSVTNNDTRPLTVKEKKLL